MEKKFKGVYQMCFDVAERVGATEEDREELYTAIEAFINKHEKYVSLEAPSNFADMTDSYPMNEIENINVLLGSEIETLKKHVYPKIHEQFEEPKICSYVQDIWVSDYNEDEIYVAVKHGIESDVESTTHEDQVTVSRKTFEIIN